MSINPFSFNVSLSKESFSTEHKEEEKTKALLKKFVTIFESYLNNKELEETLCEDSKFTLEYIEKKLEKFEKIPSEFKSPIFYELIKEPAVSPSGHTYEKEEIIKCMSKDILTDPYTRESFKYKSIIPNYTMSSMLEEFKTKRLNKIIKLVSQCYNQNLFEQANRAIEHGKLIAEKIKDKKDQKTFMHLFKLIKNSLNFSSDQIKKDISKLATSKNEALCNLGICYLNGYGVEKDYNKAAEYFTLAANQNYAPAQYHLGMCHHYGHGVKKNKNEVVRYIKLAVNQNYVPAQFKLGNCYYHGYGVEIDYNEAVKYFKLAAKKYYAPALSKLGYCYLNGHGVEKIDNEKAFNYFKLAADQKKSSARYNLGVSYFNGYGVKIDQKRATQYFRLAADQNDAYAQFMLGSLHYDGDILKKDKNKAFKYFKLAADQKYAKAQFYLGLCYCYGYGTKKNYEKAAEYFKLAADQGFVNPQGFISDTFLRTNILINKTINFFSARFF